MVLTVVLAGCAHTSEVTAKLEATADDPNAAYEANDFATCAVLYAKRGDRYNSACCYARNGQPAQAFEQLELGAANDPVVSVEALEQDQDFATLRADPR